MDEFEYTYSAPEQEEICRIREKYVPKKQNMLEKLRQLDAQAERPGKWISLLMGSGYLDFWHGDVLLFGWAAGFSGSERGRGGIFDAGDGVSCL